MISRDRMGRITAAAGALAALTLALAFALPAHPQELGYSYLQFEVSGHRISNFVSDKAYLGWLKVEGVELRLPSSAKRAKSNAAAPPQGQAPLTWEQQEARDGWISLATFMQSNPGHSGQIRFGAGDSGGMEPMFDAIKQKTIVPEADFVYYDLDKNVLIGKYKLKGIRVISLEDIPASACGMYEITLSFRSIAKQ